MKIDQSGRYLHPVTPAVLSQPLFALCQEIVPGGNPVYVDTFPVQGSSKDCFPIVEERVRTEGGKSVLGWSLWEMPTLFIEAEFHAVWQSPVGHLLDIAPKDEPTQRIYFLADPARKYEGCQVNNHRRPLRPDPVIVGFLESCDKEFEFMNRGVRAEQHGEISIQGDDAVEYQKFQMKKAQLYFQMLQLSPNIGPYSPCWCGSGQKIKWCHVVGR